MNKKRITLLLTTTILLASCGHRQDKISDRPDSLEGSNVYVNPADNKTYVGESEFKEYTPEGGVKKIEGPVQPVNVVLLTDQRILEQIISIDTLADFIKGIDALALKELAHIKESGQVVIQYTLFETKEPGLDMVFNGELPKNELDKFAAKINSYGLATRTKRDSCIFQCVYAVNLPTKP